MPQDEGQRPGPGQQRWHAVLVYFGLANPYPWDEPVPDVSDAEAGPRFTSWRAAGATLVIFAPPVIVASFRGTVAGVLAVCVVAIFVALESSLGSGLRARYTWVRDTGPVVGIAILTNVAIATDDLSFLRGAGYIAGWGAIVFGSFALLSRFEPERPASNVSPPGPPTVS